ncbi:MAG: esterase/lipase family protein [Thermodesulfovibrionales bacterium]
MKEERVKLDIRFRKGDKDKPLCVFIHGIGMDADFWTDPARARVLGGRYPLSALLGDDVEMRTSYQDFEGLGFGVLTWSQTRPAGPIAAAVRELRHILLEHSSDAREGLLFICHSRGGLVARKYLESGADTTRAVLTLSTPHGGTSLAKWAVFMSPLATAVTRLLKNFDKREADTAFRKILRFLGSSGLKELLPGSDFYRRLRDEKAKGAKYISIGGTDPDFFRALALPLPQLLAGAVPEKMFPEEMRDGRGDGLVSAASSVLPYADEHRNFPLNHASIIFDKEVRDFLIEAVQSG